jgi:hypothetical protein
VARAADRKGRVDHNVRVGPADRAASDLAAGPFAASVRAAPAAVLVEVRALNPRAQVEDPGRQQARVEVEARSRN